MTIGSSFEPLGSGEFLTPREDVGLVRRRGLEPLCLAALAPQAKTRCFLRIRNDLSR
jgi:hypothetical protein